MDSPEHIFCKWRSRFWPAKILGKYDRPLSRKSKLEVEIFEANEQTSVQWEDTKPFLMVELDNISESLDRTEKLVVTAEELSYRSALRKAMEMLKDVSTKVPKDMRIPKDYRTTGPSEVLRRSERSVGERVSQSSPKTAVQRTHSSSAMVNKDRTDRKRKNDSSSASSDRPIKSHRMSDCKNKAQNQPKVVKSIEQAVLSNTKNGNKTKGRNAGKDVLSHRKKTGNKSLSHSSRTRNERTFGKKSKIICDNSTTKEGPNDTPFNSTEEGTEKTNPISRPYGMLPEEKVRGSEAADYHPKSKYNQLPFEDFSFTEADLSSELSMECSSPESSTMPDVSPKDDTEEDIQFPVIELKIEPDSFNSGVFVWCKFQRWPYWPSLVKTVHNKEKRATIIFVEECLSDLNSKRKSIPVAFRKLKHYECPEKQELLAIARKDYGKSVDWCDALICDYRIRLGCGSFSGSFLDYCTAAISLPVRKEYSKAKLNFPTVCPKTCDPPLDLPKKCQVKNKVLPDRARAARDKANEKLIECIVKTKQAEKHLIDILKGKKTSRWLKRFQLSNHNVECLETYIEDEAQVEQVVIYLQSLCKNTRRQSKNLMNGDQAKFILEVLLPEAVIYAISVTNDVSYKKAEKTFLDGPLLSKRERKLFEKQILEKKKVKPGENLQST